MYTIANLIIQIFVNGLGTDTVAAWGTFAKIDAIYWMVVNSFGIAITTFVGQNYGAGKIQRMRKSVKVCLLMSYGAAILVSAALYGFAEPLYRLFTTCLLYTSLRMQILHLMMLLKKRLTKVGKLLLYRRIPPIHGSFAWTPALRK